VSASADSKVDVRLLIDGVPWEGAGNVVLLPGDENRGYQSGGILAMKVALPFGNHVASLEWRTSNGTAQCNPGTGLEHADLTLQECTS